MIAETFHYDPQLITTFRTSDLRDRLFAQYPMLFDQVGLEIARNQLEYHFFEWLAAITIYEESGWISLVEKNQFKSHPVQRETFKRIVSSAVFELSKPENNSGVQMSDFFVNIPDESNCYFCGVKGDKDRISNAQRKYFESIEKVSENEIIELRFVHE